MENLRLVSDYKFRLPSLAKEPAKLPNGAMLTLFCDKDAEIVRLEFVFRNAGSNNQQKFFTAAASANLLTEGSADMTGIQMADKLDYYAASVEKSVDRECSSIVFYFLKKYSLQLLPLIELIIKQPRYSEKEFEIYRNRQKQSFELNSSKTSTMAYRAFYQSLFAASNPLSRFGKVEDFDLLCPSDLRKYYDEFYSCRECEIYLAGNFTDEFLGEIESRFGSKPWGKSEIRVPQHSCETLTIPSQTLFVHKDKAAQASIRSGNLTLLHSHEDFMPLKVLIALFGGYFGSRLMTNIREEKGYTYSIGSYITTHRNCSVLSTTADVNSDKAEATLKEIDVEIERLQNDLVSQQELTMLKNYLLGECLRGLDGVFDLSEKYSIIRRSGYSLSYYDDMQRAITQTTPSQLRDLAQKYLVANNMSRVVVCDTASVRE